MPLSVTGYEHPDCFRIAVHLDDTKVLKDGSPDPKWVLLFDWGKEPPEGQTLEQYLANIKREATLLGEDELAKRIAPREINLNL